MPTNLVEFQHVKQVKQLPVLFSVLQFDIVLFQAMQCQLGVIINEYFQWLQGIEHTYNPVIQPQNQLP